MAPSSKALQPSTPTQDLDDSDQAGFLNAILESPIDYSIVALDLEGTILAWNSGAASTYGYTEEEAVGKPQSLLLSPPEELGNADTILAHARRDGRWIGPLPRARKGGERFTAQVTLTLRRSEAGKDLGFTMISEDLALKQSKADRREIAPRTTPLRRHGDSLKKLAKTGRQFFVLVSPDYKTVHYASSSYEEVWGRSCESLYARPKSWMEAIHPHDKERVMAALAKNKSARLEFQYRIIRDDGTARWIMARLEEIKDTFGDVKRLRGITLSVTDLQHEQLEVAKSELKYRRLFETAKDGILILESKTGEIVEVNPFILHLLGYSAHDCLGKKLWDIGFSKDTAFSKDLFAALQAKRYVRYEDLPLKTKDGRAVEVEFVSNVYEVGGEKVIQCNIRDITARKKTENALRESETRYRVLFEASADGILITDSETKKFRYANPALCRIFGYSAEEAGTLGIADMHPNAELPFVLAELEGLARRERAMICDIPCLRKGGTLFYSDITSVQLTIDGRLCDVVTFRDTTKRKTLEAKLRQSQKMEGIGRLAGGIAHDFNNLLTAIIGYSGFILEALAPTDPKREDVEDILKAGERAATLTRQLLAFSRQQVITHEVLDVNAVIGELDKMLRRIIGEQINLTFRPGKPLGRVMSDSGQIEQVVLNLCVNAKDSMPEGGKLVIETADVELGKDHPSRMKPGPYVKITISDTGCGMSPETLSHLFEPYFTTKAQGKGTGLGLSTVYGIVQQCGGSIDVESEPKRGTVFSIYFPRVDAALLPARANPLPPASHRGNETILLVEDDEMVRKFAARVLTENGYVALSAASPFEAIHLCKRHPGPIHLMLTDVVMPGMRGYELAKSLAPLKPEMRVMFMSGYTEQAIIRQAVLQGASFIQKPMTGEALVRQLREVLDAAPSERKSMGGPHE